MAVTRTHFAFRIDLWTSDGTSIVEHLACVEDFQLALARVPPTRPICGHSRRERRHSS